MLISILKMLVSSQQLKCRTLGDFRLYHRWVLRWSSCDTERWDKVNKFKTRSSGHLFLNFCARVLRCIWKKLMAKEHWPWPSGWLGLQSDQEEKGKKGNCPSSHEWCCWQTQLFTSFKLHFTRAKGRLQKATYSTI